MNDPKRHDRYQIIDAAEWRAGRVACPQPPCFFTPDHQNLWLGGRFANQTAVLLCGGPSVEPDLLRVVCGMPGAVTLAINNVVEHCTPVMWIGLDTPDRFMNRVLLDPRVMKFVPLAHADRPLRDRDTQLRQCPNTTFLRRNDRFDADTWFDEDTINWGQDGDADNRGGRSTMVAAMRILYILGFSRIYLVGADFEMKTGKGAYAHGQEASETAARRNNNLFGYLNTLFKKLAPEFERRGVEVINTNPDSKLEAFPKVRVEDMIATVTGPWSELTKETAAGLYDNHFHETKPHGYSRSEVRDRINAYRWGLSLEQIKEAWDLHLRAVAAKASGKLVISDGDYQRLEDKAHAAAGLIPPNGWVPAVKVEAKIPHYLDLAGKTVGVIGHGRDVLETKIGVVDAFDVVVRYGLCKLGGVDAAGTKTTVWAIDPTENGIEGHIDVMLAKLKPETVLLTCPGPTHPVKRARLAEIRYLVEKAGVPTVVVLAEKGWIGTDVLEAIRKAADPGAMTAIGVVHPDTPYWKPLP